MLRITHFDVETKTPMKDRRARKYVADVFFNVEVKHL